MATTYKSITTFSFVYHPNHRYTPSPKPLPMVMTKLIHANIIKLPPIYPIDTSKPMPKSFDENMFFKYHQQPGHDTQNNYALKNYIHGLIDPILYLVMLRLIVLI